MRPVPTLEVTTKDRLGLIEGRARLNGLDLRWVEQGTGPTVLALHGFPDLPHTFRYQSEFLARAGYRVVAPFMRGYFPSEAPPDVSYERATLTQDALALIDNISDQPVILLGHDWGAAAAYGAATIASDRIARLITIAVPYGDTWWNSLVTNPEQQRRSWYMFFFGSRLAETAVTHDDFAFIERLWRDWSPGWRFDRQDLEAVKETLRRPGVLTAALNYYRHTFDPPDDRDGSLSAVRDAYGRPIQVPTLYIHGENDGGIGVETAEGMEKFFSKGLEKHVIPDAGHFVHQEQPARVNRLILRFIEGN